MDTPLSLEIDDGCKLDNLVCEIDKNGMINEIHSKH